MNGFNKSCNRHSSSVNPRLVAKQLVVVHVVARPCVIVPYVFPCSWYFVVFVVKPSVCFCLQVMCRFMVDDLDGVACIFGNTFLLAILWWPDRSALGCGCGALRALAVGCVDVRFLVIRQDNLVDLEDLDLDC